MCAEQPLADRTATLSAGRPSPPLQAISPAESAGWPVRPPQNGASRSAHDSPLAIQLNLPRVTSRLELLEGTSSEAPSIQPGFYLLRELPSPCHSPQVSSPKRCPTGTDDNAWSFSAAHKLLRLLVRRMSFCASGPGFISRAHAAI
jgi:hypothetical protein